MTRIMVVDDHTIIRQGIAGLLRSAEDCEVVAEAGTGSAAVRLALDLRPEIIIMDVSLPDMDGLEAAKQIKGKGIESGIIFLTMHNDAGLQEMAMQTGAGGYILKDDAMDDLLYAIRAVMRGERYTSVSLTAGQAKEGGHITNRGWVTQPLLTKREAEVVALVAGGLSSKEIAERLFISIKTVETHRSHIMEKLGTGSMADVIKYAIKNGLV